MSIRVQYSFPLKISADIAGKDINFAPDPVTEGITDFTKDVHGTFDLEPGVTKVLSFGDCPDARGFYVEANGDFVLVKNASNLEELVRKPATAGKARTFGDSTLSSLTITNPAISPGGPIITGRWAVWGSPAV